MAFLSQSVNMMDYIDYIPGAYYPFDHDMLKYPVYILLNSICWPHKINQVVLPPLQFYGRFL